MFKPWIREHIEVHDDPLYSSIVRLDQYRPDKIAKRELDIGSTPAVSGLFDGVANGKKSVKIDDVPDVEIYIRENRLTQPELDKARRYFKAKAGHENEKQALEEAHSVATARDEKIGSLIDSLTSSANQSSSQSTN